MQCLRSVARGLILILLLFSLGCSYSVSAKPEQAPPVDAELIRYEQWVEEALSPALTPVATEQVRAEQGAAVAIRLDRIAAIEGGRIRVRLEAVRGHQSTLYTLTYRWEDGWKLIEAQRDQ